MPSWLFDYLTLRGNHRQPNFALTPGAQVSQTRHGVHQLAVFAILQPCQYDQCMRLGVASMSTLMKMIIGLPLVLIGAVVNGASFIPIGNFGGNPRVFESYAYALSADGTVAAGSAWAMRPEPLRWTAATGIVSLGFLPGGSPTTGSARALDISADGTVIVGFSSSGPSGNSQAFRWTAAGGMLGLGYLSGAASNRSSASAISADGTTIVGFSNSVNGQEAFRWTAAGGMVGLGDLAGGSFVSATRAVSADGRVVVGSATTAAGTEAFIWDASNGMVSLGDLPGGSVDSRANAVSANGQFVAGRGLLGGNLQAFIWSAAAGMVALDAPNSIVHFTEALAMTPDATVLVGSGRINTQGGAILWTAPTGPLWLQDLLIAQGAQIPAGWTLREALAVSSDGLTIAGMGFNADGNTEGWVAQLDSLPGVPLPAGAWLLASALAALLAIRRAAAT
jgi:probable HAF family extracellular repeat protein